MKRKRDIIYGNTRTPCLLMLAFTMFPVKKKSFSITNCSLVGTSLALDVPIHRQKQTIPTTRSMKIDEFVMETSNPNISRGTIVLTSNDDIGSFTAISLYTSALYIF
jgi:hypothetical protein